MHDVNQLLEQDEFAGNGADSRTDQDAVELPPLELGRDNRLRSLPKVGKTMMSIIA